MKKKKIALIVSLCLTLILIIGGGTYYFIIGQNRPVSANLDELWAEKVSNMVFQENLSAYSFSGKIEPEKHEKIYLEADEGTVKELFVKEGDIVEEGTPLFEYEPLEDSNQELEQLTIQLEMAYMQINQTKKRQTKLEKAIKKAEKEEKDLMQEDLEQLTFDLRMQNLEAGQVQKQIDRLKKEQEATVVESKSEGIVQTINQDLAEGAQMDQASGPFIQIVSTGSYLVKSQVNEFVIDTLELDSQMKITRKAGGEEEWIGTITDIGKLPVGSSEEGQMEYYGEMNPQSSNYPFTVVLEHHEGLEVGFHVNLEPISEEEPASSSITLMRDFIAWDDEMPYVWIVDENQLTLKQYVEIGQEFEEEFTVEVLSGLSLEDYIVYPDPSVTEGKEVMIYDSFE
ncbi:efflux RND transporter periplasmic adaptor subunit [Alkalihalobacillus sp. MEB130]|uniref:efflux RND transporter periplasmic adaptor subunit n=1 Tax=Alkalihalobacillus sp. MEB130 TaxID=2976704 RepID=UPI0028DF94BE|nr:efflux RND transporter periplasmic adaptor subunit [Alkalihalobacillus sp. MEB130]MDT8860396.1 efflux RND transporter periplasmic adaptor subunit [Alkalihalobacillus sp. MEB130]